ncbi:MAG: SDR family NAD(P)-dependent oxidoreductase [Pseudomonadota bacterium]
MTPVTLITGASRGIGRALAFEFAAVGHDLLLVARDGAALKSLSSELAERHGPGRSFAVAEIDLLSADLLDQLKRELAEQQLTIDTLVNNAGRVTETPLAQSDAQDVARLVRLNVEVPTLLVQAFLPSMIARGTGHILNVASTAGLTPVANLGAYSASKSYMISLSTALRRQVRGTGINVSVLIPGPVETDMAKTSALQANAWFNFLPWLDAGDVARLAVDGLRANRAVIVPGASNGVAVAASWVLPSALLERLVNFQLARRRP